MEIDHWGVQQRQLLESKLPSTLVAHLKNVPVMENQSEKKYEMAIEKWKELGPISLLNI